MLRTKYPSTSVRIRLHPGMNDCVPLEEDLKNASAVITWASGAAIKALLLGVPVFHSFDLWIGRKCAASTLEFPERYFSDEARDAMLNDVISAMWTGEEISTGVAFEHLLGPVC
jgi:hypothetical protein